MSAAPAHCGSCGAPIEWVLTEKGKRMPVDFQRVPTGNIVLSHRHVGEPAVAVYQTPEQIETLRKQKAARGETGPLTLFISHFATCPNAGQHRKKKR